MIAKQTFGSTGHLSIGRSPKGTRWHLQQGCQCQLGSHVQVDGKLVTGQNPASSGPAAQELLKLLRSV